MHGGGRAKGQKGSCIHSLLADGSWESLPLTLTWTPDKPQVPSGKQFAWTSGAAWRVGPRITRLWQAAGLALQDWRGTSQLLPHVLPTSRSSLQASPLAYSCLVTPSSRGSHRKQGSRGHHRRLRDNQDLCPGWLRRFVSHTRSVCRNHLRELRKMKKQRDFFFLNKRTRPNLTRP